MKRRLAAISLVLACAGCTVGPDYHPPSIAVDEQWLGAAGTGEVDASWWTRFNDPLLAELVASAMAGNKDLAVADARLREARANRDAVIGGSAPQASAIASARQSRLSENGQLPVGQVPGLGRDLSIFDAGFDASWELDLWGRSRRMAEGAAARADAAQEARRGVVIQIVAEVVRSYIDLRAAQDLHANAIADAAAQRELARLVSDRLRAGAASRLDAVRAEAQARASAATIPGFESDAAAAAFRLALLTGQPPEALHDRLRIPRPLPRTEVEAQAGMRSELLRRRPDVRQAERELAASSADIGVATAELFPRVSLLGGLGLQARDPGELVSGDSLRFGFGPSLHWPIFSGGRIRARIRASDARMEAALARYERAVIAALADSETAVNRYASAVLSEAAREEAFAAASEAVDIAKRRYLTGEDDLPALLQAQRSLSAAERLSVQARAEKLQQLAALYKALGGGWQAADASGSS